MDKILEHKDCSSSFSTFPVLICHQDTKMIWTINPGSISIKIQNTLFKCLCILNEVDWGGLRIYRSGNPLISMIIKTFGMTVNYISLKLLFCPVSAFRGWWIWEKHDSQTDANIARQWLQCRVSVGFSYARQLNTFDSFKKQWTCETLRKYKWQ